MNRDSQNGFQSKTEMMNYYRDSPDHVVLEDRYVIKTKDIEITNPWLQYTIDAGLLPETTLKHAIARAQHDPDPTPEPDTIA